MLRAVGLLVLSIFLNSLALGQSLRLFVDLTDAPKNIFHSKMTVPVKPGRFTLVYPKWIPGNHRPSGPITNLTGLRIEAAGKSIPWQRDPVDMFAFHFDVPEGISEIVASYDTITTDGSAGGNGPSASSKLLDLNWNQVVLYPAESVTDDVQVTATVLLPEGWKYATALPAHPESGETSFQPVSLTTLVDSPLIAGQHFREILLKEPGKGPLLFLDMVGESAAAIDARDTDLIAYQRLVDEAKALFQSEHYRQYRFLLTLSDEVGHHGLEHHESSDNSVGERMFSNRDLFLLEASLLPHEYAHSWNGKYRRPSGLVTRNYQEPMRGDLLWAYEGMTDYLGGILTARSGFYSQEQYREALALTAANMDHRRGRTWRTLEDTGTSVQILRLQGPNWTNWRRSLDYYPEGELIWLEVDATIRQLTKGKKSFDDFCAAFYGGESGPPRVEPYTLDDIVRTLSGIAPFEWNKLFRERTQNTSSRAPLGGIERSGWKLIYTEQPNALMAAAEKLSEGLDLSFSLGLTLDKDGNIQDVIPGSPAAKAGIAPRMKLVAVNERRWTKDLLLVALDVAKKTQQPLQLLIVNAQFLKTYSVPYQEGLKYPHLERMVGKPDLLSEIIRSRTR